MTATRIHLLTGLVHRLGDDYGVEDHLSYDKDHLRDMIDAGIVTEAAEGTSMRDALVSVQHIGDKLLILPHEFWLEDGKRARKDVTEGYDSLSTPRRVRAAVQAHVDRLRDAGKEVPGWVDEFAERQHPMTKALARELRLAPAEMYTFMMADPLPIPEHGVGQPRARERAKEERPTLGYTYTTLGSSSVHVMVPWYTLVEGGANVARLLLDLHPSFARECGGELHRRPHQEGRITYLSGRHDSVSGEESYECRLGRVAFGPENSVKARLQDWVAPEDARDWMVSWDCKDQKVLNHLFAWCDCRDFEFTSRKNRYQSGTERPGEMGSYKLCRHSAGLGFWMQAFGTHEFGDEIWHASPFLLPLHEEGGRRWSEALRFRHKLLTRVLVRDRHGSAEPMNLGTQSVFYGALNALLHEERGHGLFMPGVMTGARAYGLARQERELLKDPVYQHT